MNLATTLAERAPLPDGLTLAAIDLFCGRTRRQLAKTTFDEAGFARDMDAFPIASHTDAANRQHYEIPDEFFGLVLGPQRKYSCCFYPDAGATLAQAETCALDETFKHAGLADGQDILELGCGWGSLSRAKKWLKPDGRLFLHVFTHKARSYRFTHDGDDWIGTYFFTGGIMPAHDLVHRFPDLFTVEAEWRWSGEHYRRTAMDWLANFDAHRADIQPILRDVYGPQAGVWRKKWRLFFLATAGLWGHAGGSEWGVGHYRLTPRA